MSCSDKIDFIKKSDDELISRLQSFLHIYRISGERKIMQLKKVASHWNHKISEFEYVHGLEIEKSGFNGVLEVYGCEDSIHMILDELILNAVGASQRIGTEVIKLSINYTEEQEYIEFNITNTGSTIAKNKRPKLGTNQISSTKRGGFGFSICENLLERMGAKITKNKLHFLMNYNDSEPSFTFTFRLNKIKE